MRALASALLLGLVLAAPAWAQDETTTPGSQDQTPAPVCSGTGETAPPDECTSGDPQNADDGDTGIDPSEDGAGPAEPQGEQHVLGETSSSSGSRQPQGQAATPAPAASPAPAAQPAPAGAQLPFTGVEAWQLALAGVLLLAAGTRLRAAT